MPLCDYCHPKAHGELGYWPVSTLVKRRLHSLKAEGKQIGRRPPYGKMTDENGRIIPNPEEQYWQYVAKALHDYGLHFKRIAQMFNANRVPNAFKRGRWSGWAVNCAVKRLRNEIGEEHRPGVWSRGRKIRP